jgi:hypothetical protein
MTPAERLLRELMEVIWFHTTMPDEDKVLEIIERHLMTDSVVIVKEQPFRSQPEVNQSDDMVRVTLDMPRREWSKLKTRFVYLMTKAPDKKKYPDPELVARLRAKFLTHSVDSLTKDETVDLINHQHELINNLTKKNQQAKEEER